jgi:DNA-binding HxlR family transcriptional regulator
VEYTLTDLGRSLCDLLEAICGWAAANIERVQEAPPVHDPADGTKLA